MRTTFLRSKKEFVFQTKPSKSLLFSGKCRNSALKGSTSTLRPKSAFCTRKTAYFAGFRLFFLCFIIIGRSPFLSLIRTSRKVQDILIEANVLGKLYAVNAKKIDSPNAQVAKNSVALTHGRVYGYSIAQFLEDVNGVFDDTFSTDVYQKLGTTRRNSDFSKNLMYSERDYSEGLSAEDKAVADKVIKSLKQQKMASTYGVRNLATYTADRMS